MVAHLYVEEISHAGHREVGRRHTRDKSQGMCSTYASATLK